MINPSKSLSLGAVVLPLVRVLTAAPDLSWADREKISAAIRETHRAWDSMEKERLHIAQGAVAGQQGDPSYVTSGRGNLAGYSQGQEYNFGTILNKPIEE